MRSIRARFPVAAGDRGMTLVEVMVAMFVLAILATVVLGSMLQVIGSNRTSQAQHVAANLAAQEVALAQDTTDLFALLDTTRDVVVNGQTYTVDRETSWVTQSSEDAACGTGGGSLRFKRVNITVTWQGMSAGTEPVRADTVVDPAQRINDPAKGTILVSVIDAQGIGVAGTTVTLTATSAGASVPAATTDAQGCAYFLQVTSGTYDVTVSKSGYIGVSLETSPRQRDISVQAGSTASLGFQYDRTATLSATLAPGNGTVRLPYALPLTFISTYGVVPVDITTTATSTTTTRSIPIHPRVTYRVFAGQYGRNTGAECTSADPNAWSESTILGLGLAAGEAPEVSLNPGGTGSVQVPMGVLRVNASASDLRLTPTTPATGLLAGQPSCSASFSLRYGSVTSGTLLAVPYGSWRVTNGTTTLVTTTTTVTRGSSLLGVVTLDPRQPAS